MGAGHLDKRGKPLEPASLADHAALIYITVQGDARWHFTSARQCTVSIPVKGPLRSNNL